MFTNLTEALYTSIEISFLCSLYITIPLGLYQFWCFLVPSKFQNQRQKVNFTFGLIFLFFVTSIVFVYFFFLPKLYGFLLDFQITTHLLHIELQARIQSYVKLACKIFMFFTFFFQFPLIFFFFVKHNYVKLDFLFTNRKKIFFIVLIICSLVCPADIFSQFTVTLLIGVFLEILFFTSYLYKKKLTLYK
jgi:sec-independent protein translocase protein TatC